MELHPVDVRVHRVFGFYGAPPQGKLGAEVCRMTTDYRPQAAVLVANSIAMEVGTNNPVVIGAFNAMTAKVFPTRIRFYAMAKVWGMPAGSEHTCVIRLVEAGTNNVVAETGAHKFASIGPADVHTAISLFQGTTIPKSGTYEVQATSGGQVIGVFPLTVENPKG
jgi:hypothetical protein